MAHPKGAPVSPEQRTAALTPEQWVDRYGDLLFRFALVRVRDPHVAEDLVQSTFLAALESQGRYQGASSESTWLVGILRHKIMDHFRKTLREIPSGDLLAEASEASPSLPHEQGAWGTASTISTPEALMAQREFWATFQDCMDRLTDRARTLFILREMEGLSTEEICKTFQITPTNLWVILHRVRTQMRRCLEQRGWDRPPAGMKEGPRP